MKKERGQYKHPNHGFFKRGCTQVLLGILQEVTQAIAILVLVPFFMELTIAAETRYLQTSLNDCKRRRNPSGIGKCWLFKEPPYEPDLQVKSKSRESDDLVSILYLSSSEESVLYDVENPTTKLVDESDISTNYRHRQPSNETLQSADSGNIELKKLLSRETDRKDSNQRTKRRSHHSGRQQSLKDRERLKPKANSLQNGEGEKKVHSARNNPETKAAKDKMVRGKTRSFAKAGGTPEVKYENDRFQNDLLVIPERMRKGVNKKEVRDDADMRFLSLIHDVER